MLLVLNIVQGMIMKIQFKCECKTKTQWGHGIGDNKKKDWQGKNKEKIRPFSYALLSLAKWQSNNKNLWILCDKPKMRKQTGKMKRQNKSREQWGTTGGPVKGDIGCMIVASQLAVKWMFRCGNVSGCGGASNGVIHGSGVESSCDCGCCSGCDFCCGCESARNWGSAGHPLLHGCRQFPPRVTGT